jgi:hypothetical protein
MKALRWPQQKLVLGPALAAQESMQKGTPLTLGSMIQGGRDAVREDLSFKEMASRGGLEGKTAATVGFAGDLLLDPLMFLSPVKAIKAASTAARIPQASRALGVTSALKRLKETAPVQSFGRAFVQDFGLKTDHGKFYKELRRKLTIDESNAGRFASALGKSIEELGPESGGLMRELMELSPKFQLNKPPKYKGESLYRYPRDVNLTPGEMTRLREDIIARAPEASREPLRHLTELSEQEFNMVGERLANLGILDRKSLEAGGYSPRLFRKIESGKPPVRVRSPGELGSFTTPPKIRDTGFRKGKEYVSDERIKELGGELPPSYSVPTQLVKEESAALRGEFFEEMSKSKMSLPADYPVEFTKGYKQLAVKESLGAMSGKYVPEAMHYQLTRMGSDAPPSVWNKAVGVWKYMKVVMNPASHSRNIGSNFILADLAGLSPWKVHRYVEGWRSLSKGSADEFYRLAEKHGEHLTDTFVNAEMSLGLKNAKDLNQFKSGAKSTLARLPMKAKAVLWDSAGSAYHWEEQLFKQTFFIDHLKKAIKKGGKPLKALSESQKGTLAKASSDAAQEALFNYRNLPDAIDKLRRWGVVPFIAFPYKAITATGRAAANRPVALGRYGHLQQAFEPSNEEQISERTALPEYMQKGWMRLPEGLPYLKDKAGHARYLNLQYILPWSDVGEVADDIKEGTLLSGYLGTGGPQSSFLNIPAANLVASVVTGVNPFTGRDIEDEPGGFFQYFTDFIFPPWTGRGGREIAASIAGKPVDPMNRYGETRQVSETVAANIFGLRTRPVHITKSRRLGLDSLGRDLSDVRSKIRNIQRSRLSRGKKESATTKQLDEIREIMGKMKTIIYGR